LAEPPRAPAPQPSSRPGGFPLSSLMPSRLPARAAAALLLLLPGGCLIPPPVTETVYLPCHATASSGWTAHVERIGNGQPHPYVRSMVVVEGEVTVPSGGYAVSLADGPMDRLAKPLQQVLVRTDPPPGPSTGALVTHRVRGVFELRKRATGVRIRCGDGTLAVLRDLPREG
jgi:hypothetical protein